MVAAGIFSGLVLLSGESLVVGGLFVLLGWLFARFVGGRSLSFSLHRERLPQMLTGTGIALLVFGTLFLRYPQGLSAMFQAVPDYFAGWTRSAGASAGVPVVQILVALLVYQPLALLFGVAALFTRRTFERPLNIFLAGGLLGSLIVILLDPSRQIWMLVWVLIPLWLLAGSIVGKFIYLPSSKDRLFVAGEVIFFLILLAYWWFNLARMTRLVFVNIPPGTGLSDFQALDSTTRIYVVRFVVLIFIPLLIVLMTGITRYAWKGKAPMQGAVWSVGLFLVFYLLMTAWNFTAQPEYLAGELWVQGPATGHPEEVRAALEEASVQITGSRDQLALVYQIDSPLVNWLLRDFPNAEFQPVELQNELPDVVLNQKIDAGGEDFLTQFYRGQRIPLQFERNWGGTLPPDFVRWLVYREAPVSEDWVVIWTRADAFPLYAPQPAE
jgi:hypothetical protein